jgi:hypothetical protein
MIYPHDKGIRHERYRVMGPFYGRTDNNAKFVILKVYEGMHYHHAVYRVSDGCGGGDPTMSRNPEYTYPTVAECITAIANGPR